MCCKHCPFVVPFLPFCFLCVLWEGGYCLKVLMVPKLFHPALLYHNSDGALVRFETKSWYYPSS